MNNDSDLKHSYDVLGLPDNAAREEVEKRFDILVRQYRSKPSEEFEPIAKAYRNITGTQDRQKFEELTRQKYAKYKGFAGPAEKIDDFFRLYKGRVLAGLIALIAVIVGLNAYLNHRAEQERLAKLPPVDLSVMVLGDFSSTGAEGDTSALEESLKAPFPEWKRVTALLSYLPKQSLGQATMAMQQKALLQIGTERPDLFLMDKEAYTWISNSNALMNLDNEAKSRLKPWLKESQALKAKQLDDPAEHIYGIDVSNSPLAAKLQLTHTGLILGVRDGAEHKEQALHFIEQYLKAK
ncbi:molecular chaperone DnaJ [Paenibacillus sp. YPG26]|uniref:molecular chaperone DnaJ n=1 Tax=Paenibacillus sp. YPG26 TaxID=2878915 RepID=UPI00203E5802|nr:molecular chaperone DnaJ [Paenibacillus sp. YPG26]USB32179.1 molecular chaperone DnaJ [Paenibacillus sp. YPG26]